MNNYGYLYWLAPSAKYMITKYFTSLKKKCHWLHDDNFINLEIST
jgi:hypothetical protein